MPVDESMPTSVIHLDLQIMVCCLIDSIGSVVELCHTAVKAHLHLTCQALQYVHSEKRYGYLREVRHCDECLSGVLDKYVCV